MPIPTWLTADAGVQWMMPDSAMRPTNAEVLAWTASSWQVVGTDSDIDNIEAMINARMNQYRWVWLYFPAGWGLPYQGGWWGGMLAPGYTLEDIHRNIQYYGP